MSLNVWMGYLISIIVGFKGNYVGKTNFSWSIFVSLSIN